jgi:hypothetical protein
LNADEARKFLTDVAFVAFPSVRDWLRGTDRAEETFSLWTQSMSSLGWSECETMIGKWLSGDVPPPRFLRDSFVAELRACVLDQRSKQAAKARFDEPTAAVDEPEGQRYQPTKDPLYLKYWVPLKGAVDAKEITEDSALSQWNAILDEQFSKAGGTTWIG